MSTPDLSVIVAVYEQAETLPLVCEALGLQDYSGSWELIVCDDGSAADYREFLQRASTRLGHDVRYVWQPHEGRRVARSRNNGIRCARGDLLVFLDGDCLVPRDFLSRHAAAHFTSNRLLCGSRTFLFTEPGDLHWLGKSSRIDSLLRRCERLPLYSMRDWQNRAFARAPWAGCMSCNLSVPRRDEVYFDENFTGWGSEDLEFACRLFYRSQYEVSIEPRIDCYTLEPGPAHEFCTIRPESHDAIVACLRDLNYFRYVHRDLPVESIMMMCRHFALDPETGRWQRLPFEEALGRSSKAATDEVERWLAETEAESEWARAAGVTEV